MVSSHSKTAATSPSSLVTENISPSLPDSADPLTGDIVLVDGAKEVANEEQEFSWQQEPAFRPNVRLRDDSVNLTKSFPCLLSINGNICGKVDETLLSSIGRFPISTTIGFSTRLIYNVATIPRFEIMVVFRYYSLSDSYEPIDLDLIDIPFNQEFPEPRIEIPQPCVE
ncbi:hypothetical protein F5Y10DRAFT_264336 [Nemania abortiva]|nr:hypothetical protein F5Y10DRAFT_264336 [Nemania abortiva]